MKTAYFSILCTNLHLLSGSHAFVPARIPLANNVSTQRRTRIAVGLSEETAAPVAASTDAPPAASPDASSSSTATSSATPPPALDSKQHLYGRDMIDPTTGALSSALDSSIARKIENVDTSQVIVGAEPVVLPLPETYITCGRCKSLFAIAESDLGTRGKGCRVKCCVCDNSWYQSRDRLLTIPVQSHDLLPAPKSDLDRIATNLAMDKDPDFTGVYKLYVGNLDWTTTEEDLKTFFESNGGQDGGEEIKVCDVSVVMGPEGRSRGFAFVSFYDEDAGRAAVKLDGMECNGRNLSVREPNN